MVLVSLIFIGVISFAIAEFLGASKHIGRGWSFALSFTGFILVGIIATLLSPSAKKSHTKGHLAHLIVGVLFLIHGLLTIIFFLVQANPVGISQSLAFIFLGIYLVLLSKNVIVNNKPKFYFNLPELSFFNLQTQSFDSENCFYYIINDGTNSEPLTLAELKSLKIKENTPIWRKGLDDWKLAKELKELEDVICFEPPIYTPISSKVIENVEPPVFNGSATVKEDKTEDDEFSSTSTKQYFIMQDGHKIGPITKDVLAKYYVSDEIWVWTNGLKDWVQIKDLEELNYPKYPRVNVKREKILRVISILLCLLIIGIILSNYIILYLDNL